MKFETYADLANMGAHLDVAADQTSFIKHDGLDAKQFDNKTSSSRLAHHEVRRQSSISGFLGSSVFDWRCALLRSILKPRATWEKMYSEGRDFGDKPAFSAHTGALAHAG